MTEFKIAEVPADVRALHDGAVVVDAHHDILLHVENRRRAGERGVLASFWGPQLMAGGVDVQVFPIYVQSDYMPELSLRQTLRCVEAFWRDLEDDPGPFLPACSFAEIQGALCENKIGALLALEGMEGLGYDLEFLSLFYRLGVRVASLTWNRRTAFADGAGETATGGGLTHLGRAAIEEMDRLGMLIDLAHLSERGFWDAIGLSKNTVVASHAAVYSLVNHPRNLHDDQIRALADTDGVIGLMFHPAVIGPACPNVARAVDHIAYIADLVGIEHVGLGSDFMTFVLEVSGTYARQAMMSQAILESTVEGLEQVGQLPNITAEMKARGFRDDEIRLVLGGNFLRVFKEILA